MLKLKRAYEPASPRDGRRVLVERLWPRGVRKEDLGEDAWLRELAPSTELRKWYAHDVAKWPEFRRRYRAELDAHPDTWKPLLEASRRGTVTLLYAAHDEEHNSAVVLSEYLRAKSGGARSTASRSTRAAARPKKTRATAKRGARSKTRR